MVFPENYKYEDIFNKVVNTDLMEEIKHQAKEMSKETGEEERVCIANLVLKDQSVADKLKIALKPNCKSPEELEKLFEKPHFNFQEIFLDEVW